MRVIDYRVGRRGFLLTPMAILLVVLGHLCCLLPLLVPLGFGGALSLAGNLKPWLTLAAVILLIIKGWKIYRSGSGLPEKIIFWIAVAFVMLMSLVN